MSCCLNTCMLNDHHRVIAAALRPLPDWLHWVQYSIFWSQLSCHTPLHSTFRSELKCITLTPDAVSTNGWLHWVKSNSYPYPVSSVESPDSSAQYLPKWTEVHHSDTQMQCLILSTVSSEVSWVGTLLCTVLSEVNWSALQSKSYPYWMKQGLFDRGAGAHFVG